MTCLFVKPTKTLLRLWDVLRKVGDLCAVATHKLRRVYIPTLVETKRYASQHVGDMRLPRAAHGHVIRAVLLGAQGFGAVKLHGHPVRHAVHSIYLARSARKAHCKAGRVTIGVRKDGCGMGHAQLGEQIVRAQM